MALFYGAFVVFWFFVASADLVDGAITTNGKDVEAATDPFRFRLAVVAIAVGELYAITMLIRYLGALRSRKDEER